MSAVLFVAPEGSAAHELYRSCARSGSASAAARRRLTEQGYTVLLTLGDQPSDLEGGYAERAYLVPNPFYRVK